MVKQRGQVWYARIEVKDDSGRRRQKWVSLPEAKNITEAKERKKDIAAEMRTGARPVDPVRKTVAQFLEEWLVGIEASVEERTFAEYRQKVRRHLIPHLGGMRLGELRSAKIRTFQAMLLKSGRLDKKGGLNPSTVERILCLLKQALQQAVDDDTLPKNEARKVKPPRPQRKELACPDDAEVAALLRAAAESDRRTRTTSLYLPLLLLAGTALRRNEALGLRWQDLDMDRGLLTVNQTLIQAKGGVRVKPSPKNSSSRRTIKLPLMVVEALRGHREAQFARRQELGEGYQDKGLVFERGDGTPIRPSTFSNAVAEMARRAGLGDIHVHMLRHAHISRLIAQGEHMKAISARAGHSRIQTTMNVYGHLMPGAEDEMMERFDASFRAALERIG